jgi:hypothetical protein
VTNFGLVTILSLFILAARSVFADVYLRGVVFVSTVNASEVQDERDPNELEDCLALGELEIGFHTDHSGPPAIGVVLTDPRGRRIGFDPLSGRGWQELPEAQGVIDCDASDGKQTCRGIVGVCGPLSGVSKVEIIAQETSHFTVSFFARSAVTGSRENLRSSDSSLNVRDTMIRKGSRHVISVNYSRDPALKIALQLEKSYEHRYQAGLHSTPCQSSKRRSKGCPKTHTAGD